MKKILIATFALAVMLGACKKEDVTKVMPKEVETQDVSGSKVSGNTSKPVYQPYTVVNGRAVFATVADFETVGRNLEKQSKDYLINGWGTMCGYNTLLRTVDQQSWLKGVTQNISSMAIYGVEDDLYASILNDQGEVQLGDTIAKVIGEQEYIYHAGNVVATTASATAQANGTIATLGSQLAAIAGVRVRNTDGYGNGGNRVPVIPLAPCPAANINITEQYFNANQRSKFKFAGRNYLFYGAINVVVDMERKLTGWWSWLFGWGHTNVVTTKEFQYSLAYKRYTPGFNTCYVAISGVGDDVDRDPITNQFPASINVVDIGSGVHQRRIAVFYGPVLFDLRTLNVTLKNTYNGVTHSQVFGSSCGPTVPQPQFCK